MSNLTKPSVKNREYYDFLPSAVAVLERPPAVQYRIAIKFN